MTLFRIAYLYIQSQIIQPIDWLVMRKEHEKIHKQRQLFTFEELADKTKLGKLDHHPLAMLSLLLNERSYRCNKVNLGHHVVLELDIDINELIYIFYYNLI